MHVSLLVEARHADCRLDRAGEVGKGKGVEPDVSGDARGRVNTLLVQWYRASRNGIFKHKVLRLLPDPYLVARGQRPHHDYSLRYHSNVPSKRRIYEMIEGFLDGFVLLMNRFLWRTLQVLKSAELSSTSLSTGHLDSQGIGNRLSGVLHGVLLDTGSAEDCLLHAGLCRTSSPRWL